MDICAKTRLSEISELKWLGWMATRDSPAFCPVAVQTKLRKSALKQDLVSFH